MAAVVAHSDTSSAPQIDLSSERAKLAGVLQQEKLTLEMQNCAGGSWRQEVEERWSDAMATMRAKLLALPTKLAIAVAPRNACRSRRIGRNR